MSHLIVNHDDQVASSTDGEMILPAPFLLKILSTGEHADLSVACDGYQFQLHRLVVGVKAPELANLKDNAVVVRVFRESRRNQS